MPKHVENAITNQVTFCYMNDKLAMVATTCGKNNGRIFDVAYDFGQNDMVDVGALPNGLWASPDGE